MQLSNAPAKLVLPFANSGGRRVIPVPSQIPITPGAASWTDGFPPLTRTAVSSGGVPPSGIDMNGVLYTMSAADVWANTGAGYPFDAAFAAAIGGYPRGARVLSNTGNGYWLCTTDNNSQDPNSMSSTGWVPQFGVTSSVYASVQQTLGVGSNKIGYNAVAFDDQQLWDAANSRFRARWPGKYRISGSTLFKSPSGQNLGVSVVINDGEFSQNCFGMPQVSDGDISMQFSAIFDLNISDFANPYVFAEQSSINLGVVGSNKTWVYAQIEYIGV